MILTRSILLISILASAACAGKRTESGSLPSDPIATVQQFMAAVKASDIGAMGDLWGSNKGPANSWMDAGDREKRLRIMQITLASDSYAVDPAGTSPGASDRERVIRVQLRRNNCQPMVPFTLLRVGDGWLVSNIDLDAAGSPRRPCQ